MTIANRLILYPNPALEATPAVWERSKDNDWWQPNSELYSFYPSTHLLLPGDILLFAPQEAGFSQRLIQSKQHSWGRTDADHNKYTHAAIYIGSDHIICEAIVESGVTYSSLESYIGSRCFIARRWPNISLETRFKISLEASRWLKFKYNKAVFIPGGLSEKWANSFNKKEGKFICSRLCERAIRLALANSGINDAPFHDDPTALVTPAVLSQTDSLVDIDLEWRRVPN